MILGDFSEDQLTVRWRAPLQGDSGVQMSYEPLEYVEPHLSPGEFILFLAPVPESDGVFWATYQNFGSVWRVLPDGHVEAPPASEPYFEGMTVDELADAVRDAAQP